MFNKINFKSMKKVIFISIALLVISMSSTSAQAVWGLRAGVSRPTLTLSMAGQTFKQTDKFGLEIGPVLYYSFNDQLYINSGLQFSMKSFKTVEIEYDDYDYEILGEGSLNTFFLDIPLYLGFNIPIGNVRTYAQAGPYIGFKLSEKLKMDTEYDYEDGTILNTFNAGVGVMYGINLNRFKIEMGYQFGLTKIADYTKMSSLFLGVSYVF